MRLIAAMLCLALSGCTSLSSGSGVKWYNPTTWFSGGALRDSAKVEAQIVKVGDKVLTEAQKSAHEAQNALLVAPASRSVQVAMAANDNTVALLDQLSGPLSAPEVAQIKEKVRLLTSDLAAERAKGEAMQLDAQKRIDQVSSQLVTLGEEKKAADAALAKSFANENALANELRNEKWWSWFWRITIGGVLLIAAAAYIYLRFTLGGLPTALSGTIAHLREAEPELAGKLTSALDVHLSPAEQAMIRMLVAKKT